MSNHADKNVIDVFITGARKGWDIAITSIIPNVIFAYVLIQFMEATGFMKLMEAACAPLMGIFGLPGAAMAVLLAALMSMNGAAGVAAGLFAAGKLNGVDVAILLPSILLMGAKVQYLGRMLGTAGVEKRFYMPLLGVSLLNAILSLFVMLFLVSVF